jgi:hypothetical protein
MDKRGAALHVFRRLLDDLKLVQKLVRDFVFYCWHSAGRLILNFYNFP